MKPTTQHTAEPTLVNLTLRPLNEVRRHSSGYIAFDDEPYKRVRECTNALAGIADPAATLRSVREALENARSFAGNCRGRLSGDVRKQMLEVEAQTIAALALLPPNQDAKV